MLLIGHSSLIGGEFSAVFLLGRRLHVSAGGFASPSRASAFGNIPLRRPFEVLVRFSLDVQPVRASRLREIFGPVATPFWKFSTMLGHFAGTAFPFSIYY